MIVEFDKSFKKSLDQLHDKSLFKKIEGLIESLESSNSISEFSNIKKLSGYKVYYRVRLGDYRLGFEKINEKTIRFIVIAHRKTIYKIFP
jgi:mRNA interferase RelE/StbE